jgi:hypothetical protein
MKKIFTLFAVALLGLCAYAQDGNEGQACPSRLELTELAPNQAANEVFLELGLVYNNSENLNGYNMEIGKPAGATWKRQGANFVYVKDDYARFILEMINLDGATIDDFSNSDLNDIIGDMFDNKANVKAEGGGGKTDVLSIIHILATNDCRFFPNHAGKIGKIKIDMSALDDGQYELVADAEPYGCSFSYTGGPEGTTAWTADPIDDSKANAALRTVLKKEGDQVTQVATGINVLEGLKNVTSVKYYNIQGVESATPFDGVNIVVRTYEDGSKDAIKILK